MTLGTNDIIVWLILYFVFLFVVIIQLFYYWYFFGKLAFYKPPKRRKTTKPISVIICARNEYKNLKENLPLILEQDYPEFEVVVVNDASTDNTADFLEDLSKKHKNINFVNLYDNLNFFKGKKFPLSIGIKSAKNDLLLFTDADCKPASKYWIQTMVNNFSRDRKIIIGYGAYEKRKGLLDKLIRFDTMHVAIQYLSYALQGMPYMGVGRNLAYERSLFYNTKGFTSHYKIKSGDDDLFINKVADAKNTTIEIRQKAHTVSTPVKSFHLWLRQKRRHLTTGRYYKNRFKYLLGLYSLSQFLFYLLFVILLSVSFNWILIVALLGVRFVSQAIILKKCSYKLNEKDLLLFSPIYEILLISMNIILLTTNLFFRQNKWK